MVTSTTMNFYVNDDTKIRRQFFILKIFLHMVTYTFLFHFVKLEACVGTAEYMAIEMFDEDKYDENVDIYAFVMCLLEMITMETPYKECVNTIQIYNKKKECILPKSLEKVYNKELKSLITKLLDEKSKRPSSDEILDIIENICIK